MTAPSIDDNENPTKTINYNGGTIRWCEVCSTSTQAIWTTIKIFKAGREIERQKCDECKSVQETEYYTGPTTKIKNKRDK